MLYKHHKNIYIHADLDFILVRIIDIYNDGEDKNNVVEKCRIYLKKGN
jgi:hypothetical protein